MTIKLFTEKEVKILSKNPYVKLVSLRGITYTHEFKCIFIEENEKGNIFEASGFDVEIIGIQQVESSGNRYGILSIRKMVYLA